MDFDLVLVEVLSSFQTFGPWSGKDKFPYLIFIFGKFHHDTNW